ncbi:LIM/homeobox protein Lhx9 isoform X2 [Ixodes scapularis]|nr:LIM/homeobox protein Lhx9 isoform X2 [Ixodes scapularis]
MITSSSPANPSASRDQQPKTSPDGHDQTPSHDRPCSPKPGVVEDGSLLCSGCEIPIQERFYLQALDRPWHTGCLRCCRCGAGLDTQASCFAREGRIYCKDDYLRAFVRCCACGSALAPRDLVMRVRGVSFHVACFRCASCHCPLLKGDVFGMRDNRVFCRLHFLGHSPSDEPKTRGVGTTAETVAGTVGLGAPVLVGVFVHHADVTGKTKRSSYKRMRTSFKHSQLRAMKAYFTVNHNPDSKDLKQLSARTGLSKRVLQVWFQNARAKWRRNLLRQASHGPEVAQDSSPLQDLGATITLEEQTIHSYANLL